MNRADTPIRSQVRQSVEALLSQSPAFRQLHADKQQQIARDMAVVFGCLAAHGDDRASNLRPPAAEPGAYADLLQAVDFPDFVAGLIKGVFNAIVQASIQQMEAYARLMADVAKSVDQFADEAASEDQARDHLVEEFPDLFEVCRAGISDRSTPCLKLRGGVDAHEALKRIRGRLGVQDSPLRSLDLSDRSAEKTLLLAARTHLVRNRQQLLANMVLMGINRIVVTSGSIKAR